MSQISRPPPPKFLAGQRVNGETNTLFERVEIEATIVRGIYNPETRHVEVNNGHGFIMIQQGWLYVIDKVDSVTKQNFAFHESQLKLVYQPAEKSFDELLEFLRN